MDTMTPREIVKRAVEFRDPPRLAINGFGELSDCIWVFDEQIRPPEAEGKQFYDQWMCRWERSDEPNMGQIKGHPLEDLAKMDSFPWPDPADPKRFATVPAQLDAIDADPAQRGKYRICSIFMLLWERMQALHGMEACMMDMMDDRPEIHELADRLVEYDVAWIRNMGRVCGDRVDCLNFSDDWGTETDLMVSPALFRSFFLPRYKRVFDAAREQGWHRWMHSCGKINKAIGMLVEAGVNVLNMQQPVTNGIEEIGREFAGKVAFETLCDIQKTLPKGDRGEIVRQAEELMRHWGTSKGGFVLGDYGDARAIGTQADTKSFMLGVFQQKDPWVRGDAAFWGA